MAHCQPAVLLPAISGTLTKQAGRPTNQRTTTPAVCRRVTPAGARHQNIRTNPNLQGHRAALDERCRRKRCRPDD